MAEVRVDFDAVYQGASTAEGGVPWMIGRPQSAVVALADDDQVSGDVLDVGCGAGDNAIFLASRGYRITAVDGSAIAIEMAKQRAQAAEVDVEFAVADATTMDGYDGRFDTVVDSALYHCLTQEQQHQYMAALHRVTKPGARLHLLCFTEDLPPVMPDAFRTSEQSLRDTVSRKWTITGLDRAWYESAMSRTGFEQAINDLTGSGDTGSDDTGTDDPLTSVRVGEDGLLLIPMWRLAATRND
jgi:ubiquinone/menaquinone biosynthesis C-methylase UbiE